MNRHEERCVRTSVAAWWRYSVRNVPAHLCGSVTAWRESLNEAARLSDSRSTRTPTHESKDPSFRCQLTPGGMRG